MLDFIIEDKHCVVQKKPITGIYLSDAQKIDIFMPF